MDPSDTAKSRAKLTIERSLELRRFSNAYPGAVERFKEIEQAAPNDLKDTLRHVVDLLSDTEAPDLSDVTAYYRLTKTEARLAEFLMSGGSLSDYAEQASVTRNTARNQLQSIFQKVGVNRQAELVAAMLKVARHFESGGKRKDQQTE